MTRTTVPAPAQAPSPGALRSALAAGARPTRPTAAVASLTFTWRSLLKIKHSPGLLFNVIAAPIMFTLVFTYLFGGALAGSTSDYLQFLLPGILVQTVLFLTTQTGVGLNSDLDSGAFDRFRTLPLWRPAPLTGALLSDLVRYLLATTVVLVLGLVLGFRPEGGLTGVAAAVLLLLLFSFCVSWVWTLLSLLAPSPEVVAGLGATLLFLLTFASNIFVDPVTMPGWLKGFVAVNPVALVVTAVRDLMAGASDPAELLVVLLAAGIILAAFAPLTIWRYQAKQ